MQIYYGPRSEKMRTDHLSYLTQEDTFMAKIQRRENRERTHDSCGSYRSNNRRFIREARWNKRKIW